MSLETDDERVDTRPYQWEKALEEELYLGPRRYLRTLKKILLPSLTSEIDKILTHKVMLLEAGCGAGRHLFPLASNKFVEYSVGVDFSHGAIRIAKRLSSQQKIEGVAFVTGDIRNLPFRDDDFDVVLSLGVIEHFSDPLPLIMEMKRVLKSNGLLFLETPNKSAFAMTEAMITRAKERFGRQDLYSPEELGVLVKKCDMHLIKAYPHDFVEAVFERFTHYTQDILPTRLYVFLGIVIRLFFRIFDPIMKHGGFFSIVVARKNVEALAQ